jgi:hypothetical protein
LVDSCTVPRAAGGGKAPGAQGIEAEILVARLPGNKIGAESPVFCRGAAKNALKFSKKSFVMLHYWLNYRATIQEDYIGV